MRHLGGSAAILVIALVSFSGCGLVIDPEYRRDTRAFSRVEQTTLPVGQLGSLRVESFVGKVTLRPGVEGVVKVIATRFAWRRDLLDELDVEVSAAGDGASIRASNPTQASNVAVELEIVAPPSVTPEIRVGVGDIDYQGWAPGACWFETGVGSIDLRIPAGANLQLDLAAGMGAIHLDRAVDGQVLERFVSGTLGTGSDGELHAHTGVGSIRLSAR